MSVDESVNNAISVLSQISPSRTLSFEEQRTLILSLTDISTQIQSSILLAQTVQKTLGDPNLQEHSLVSVLTLSISLPDQTIQRLVIDILRNLMRWSGSAAVLKSGLILVTIEAVKPHHVPFSESPLHKSMLSLVSAGMSMYLYWGIISMINQITQSFSMFIEQSMSIALKLEPYLQILLRTNEIALMEDYGEEMDSIMMVLVDLSQVSQKITDMLDAIGFWEKHSDYLIHVEKHQTLGTYMDRLSRSRSEIVLEEEKQYFSNTKLQTVRHLRMVTYGMTDILEAIALEFGGPSRFIEWNRRVWMILNRFGANVGSRNG
ncbi:hypothetical protein BLNAU_960 [Blattamonas nauphoetae]|uniref:Uncharacterized protein n=1 Tax=Blattamonas nauphoetae TaxID=2049346 RepID=A0ABQ9YJG7_9EUKA|nr:hypothetical protein BLNAU_960 [Blattamonas nauphoetae]